MAEITFNTKANQEIARDLVVLMVNTATHDSPEWHPVGYGVEDSAAEYDWQRESKKDILGNTFTTMKKPIITQSFDAWSLRSGDAAQKYFWDLAVKDQDAQGMANVDCLVIHKYAGAENTAMFAERYTGTAIEMSGFGGEGGGNIVMPITAVYGGERTTGTAEIQSGTVTFTPDAD